MRKQNMNLVGVDSKPSLSSVHLGFAAVPGSEESSAQPRRGEHHIQMAFTVYKESSSLGAGSTFA